MLVTFTMFAVLTAAPAVADVGGTGMLTPTTSQRAAAIVLGFDETGTRALVADVLTSSVLAGDGDAVDDLSGTTRVLSYRVVSAGREEAAVVVSRAVRGTEGVVAEAVDRDVCRERARELERALVGFRSVAVRVSGCSRPSRNEGIVEVKRKAPRPLAASAALTELHGSLGEIAGSPVWGETYVSEDGPLVVVIQQAPTVLGSVPLVRTFLRSDPRLHDRWPSP